MICKGPFATYHNAANEFERKNRFSMHKEISMHNMENVKKRVKYYDLAVIHYHQGMKCL